MFSRSKRLRSGALCAVDDDALILLVEFNRLGKAERLDLRNFEQHADSSPLAGPAVTGTQLFPLSVSVHGLDTVYMASVTRALRPVCLLSCGSDPSIVHCSPLGNRLSPSPALRSVYALHPLYGRMRRNLAFCGVDLACTERSRC